MADVLLLGGAAHVYQPDALENFAASAESSVVCEVRGKRFAPLGPDDDIVWRRLLITGYQRSSFAFYVTPYLEGRALPAVYCSRPGPAEGVETRFSILVPLSVTDADFPGMRFGMIGSTLDALIQITDPSARFDLEAVTFLHEQIGDARGRQVDE